MNYCDWYKSRFCFNTTTVNQRNRSNNFFTKYKLRAFALGCISTIMTAIPTSAAERVSLSYEPLEFSIPIASLEIYAQEGRIDSHLAEYAQYIKPDELAELRKTLVERVDLSAVTVAQFLYSSLGETLLQYLGDLIQTDTHQNGFYALRASMILAARDSKGLSLLNILKKFPSQTIRINKSTLKIATAFSQMFKKTNQLTALIEQQAAIEAATGSSVHLAQRIDLQQPGSFTWQKTTLTLNDSKRGRKFIVDLYLPNRLSTIPVLVISHGLASDRTNFADLAQHLASHGFAVAMLEHPGSDRQQLENLLRGMAKEVVEPNEFVNRPKDVSYLLDELQQLNKSNPTMQGRLNLQKVGILGHSFGGYTALAVAGAKLNFKLLQRECRSSVIDLNTTNLSGLLQCQALYLSPTTNYRLQDKRIGAVFAINPISNSVFGETNLSQVRVPVLLVAGSRDLITPALIEQVCPFTWLTTPNKYLLWIQGGTHFYSGQASGNNVLSISPELASPNSALARRYLKRLSLAFAKTYIAAQPEYRVYLQASYVQSISQPPLQLRLIHSLSTTQLSQSLNFSCPGSQTLP